MAGVYRHMLPCPALIWKQKKHFTAWASYFSAYKVYKGIVIIKMKTLATCYGHLWYKGWEGVNGTAIARVLCSEWSGRVVKVSKHAFFSPAASWWPCVVTQTAPWLAFNSNKICSFNKKEFKWELKARPPFPLATLFFCGCPARTDCHFNCGYKIYIRFQDLA